MFIMTGRRRRRRRRQHNIEELIFLLIFQRVLVNWVSFAINDDDLNNTNYSQTLNKA